jgi:hypothetical protein
MILIMPVGGCYFQADRCSGMDNGEFFRKFFGVTLNKLAPTFAIWVDLINPLEVRNDAGAEVATGGI